jgi:predicted metal-dependent enzyme (double-stranded beta helix superfamily)
MSRLSVIDLAKHLDALSDLASNGIPGPDPAAVSELLGDEALDLDSLRPFIGARPDKYARRLVHRSPRFDVMVLTWMPGQSTPIHNHAGNCGWIRLIQGRIREDAFALAPSARESGFDLAPDLPAAAQARTGRIELVPTATTLVETRGSVSSVDRQRAIHRIANPLEHRDDEVAVTLHVYCKPHDVCLIFDPETKTCGRREMSFDEAP